MDITFLFIASIFLFIIIYFSVSLAIRPLSQVKEYVFKEDEASSLVKLRDMGVIAPDELNDIIMLYRNKSFKAKNYEQYKKYEKVLSQLQIEGYLNHEDYNNRISKLKQYFNIED